MKRIIILLLMGLIGALSTFSAPLYFSQSEEAFQAYAKSPSEKKRFRVFDATLYSGKPDLTIYDIQPIHIIYAGKLGSDWLKTPERLPVIESVQQVAREVKAKADLAIIDIEHWPLQGNSGLVQGSVKKYTTVLQTFREAAPDLLLGYYGAPPVRDYWRAVKDPSHHEHSAWMAENDQLKPLANAVDIFFPSLYTFYPDQAGWKKYAIAQIEEARRYGNGKPVYVFLWPQYHDSNHLLSGQYLPADFWRLELETAQKYADGIIIWGGWGSHNRPAAWDEEAAWWKVTKEFMKSINQARLNAPESLSVQ